MQHRRQQQQPQQQGNDDDLAFRSSSLPDDGTLNVDDINDDDDDDLRKRMKMQKHAKNKRKGMIIRIAAILTGMIFFLYIAVRNNNKYMTVHFCLRIIILYPVYFCGYTCLRHVMTLMTMNSSSRQQQQPQQQQQQQLQQQYRERIKKILMPLTLIVTVISAQLPSYIGAAIATICIIAFSIVTRPALLHHEMNVATGTTSSTTVNASSTTNITTTTITTKSKVTFGTVVISMITMIVVLLVENFLIWVVSATFLPGHSATTAPPPLQDNGQRVLNYIFHTVLQIPSKASVVSLRRLLNTQWSLVACVGTSFVVTEVYDPRRTLYGIANRALLTIAIARFIRTMSFIMTVVPSQNQNCYVQRGFPLPPPSDWMDWIWIGIIPRSHGGCNDLIISGHATIISTCMYTALYST